MFKVVVRNSFWDLYDSLGRMVGASLLWFLPFLSLFLFAVHRAVIPSVLSLLLLCMASAGLLQFTYISMFGKDPSIEDFLAGVRKGFHRLLGFWGISFLISMPVLFSIGFYLRRYESWGIPALFLSGLGFWILFFLAMAQIYGLPLILHVGPCSAIRVASALVIRHLPYTLLISSFALAVSLLLMLSGLGFPLLEGAFLCSLFNNALSELLRIYKDDGLPQRGRHEGRGIGELIRPWNLP
jgi:hypothetical protein